MKVGYESLKSLSVKLTTENFNKLIESIKDRYKTLFKAKKEEKKVKAESKLWKDVTGYSKNEIKDLAATDFHSFMLTSFFDVARIKNSLNAKQIATKPSHSTMSSYFDKLKSEADYLKRHAKDAAFNAYNDRVF